MMSGNFGMGLGGGFMGLFWILLIVVIVWAVIAAIGRGNSSAEHGKSPLEILKDRYAKDEINQDEVERVKADLGGTEQIGDNDEIARSNETYRYLGSQAKNQDTGTKPWR